MHPYKKMMQNLVWATPYNVIAIPAAAGALVHWEFSPDEHRCPRDEPVDCDRGGGTRSFYPFQTLTLLTML